MQHCPRPIVLTHMVQDAGNVKITIYTEYYYSVLIRRVVSHRVACVMQYLTKT